MKLIFILLGFTFSVSALGQTAKPVKKIALIVAIGNYPDNSGWGSIASINDVKYVKGALINKGFKEKDIDTLKDKRATKAGILAALDNLARKTGQNDIVVIHFSCHGQQIEDQLTEAEGKDEVDGYDEAIIPYDAKAMYNPNSLQDGGYHGENHLRDDDLGKKFTAIRNKIKPNGNLLVLIDACHSGTASRATETFISRGSPIPFEEPGYKVDINLSRVLNTGKQLNFIGDGADTLSNMVVISASSPQQQNFQLWDDKGVDVGSLSFSFAKAMNDIQPGDDYGLLFEKIKARIQAGIPAQVPMIEGNLQQQVLGAQFNAAKDNIIVTISKADKMVKEDSVFIINKGALDNISKGSTCKIYAAGKKEVLTEGVIVKVGTFQSSGVAKKLLKKEEAYRAVMDEVNYGDFSTSVSIANNIKNNKELKNQLDNVFLPYQFISINKNNNAEMMLTIAEQNGKAKMELYDRGDSTRWIKELSLSDTLSEKDKEDLIANIKTSARVKYLRSLPDGGDLNKNFKIELSANNIEAGSELVLKPRDSYKLKLTNNGKEPLYFSILDIMPDNKVDVLIPNKGHEADEFSIKPGQSLPFTATVDSTTPSGKEIFKVFITRQAIDLRKVFNRKNKNDTRAAFTLSLEDMIDDTFKDRDDVAATRSDVSSVKLNEAGILTAGITIKKQ